jgi:hypothetical protein
MYCGESFSPEAGFTACPHGAVPAEREKPMNDVPVSSVGMKYLD